ncbi:ADP-dependent NAD(P)H-hydrate dehydratase, partial [Microbacterium sp.]|uniref:ADP-dependent NAD(P)H-hydrate dehydratase n=1 Tax=Microbacterium sp. TaxID=51671 RepID=UPI003C726443
MDSSREWSAADAAASLRMPTPGDDKYSRGVVGLRTGSDEYPGAAVLGVEAAWRTGVGMVRYLGPAGPRDLVLQRRPETVTVAGRVQAWVIGSGMPAGDRRTPEQTATLRDILAADVPVVIDAGALDLVTVDSEVGESGAGDAGAHAPRVLTPHDREHAALRHRLGLPE